MPSLYEINDEILNCVDTETGEVIDFEKFEKLKLEKNGKIEILALWYKNLISDAEAFKKEEDNLKARRKSAEGKAESIKKYLDSALNGLKFSTSKVNITYRKSESVEIEDVFKIDDSFLKYSEPLPDKKAIKEAMQAGATFEGVSLVEKQNIQIK